MMKYTALLLALLMVVGSANAQRTAYLKDMIFEGSGDEYLFDKIEIEDGTLKWDCPGAFPPVDPDDYDYTTDPMSYAKGTPKDNDMEGNYSNVPGPEWGQYGEVLTGVQNFFDLLPEAILTGPEDIVHCDMVLYQGGPTGGEELGIFRVTTPWLAEGEDSGNVSAVTRMAKPGGETGPWWAADAYKADPGGTDPDYSGFTGFSPADYTTEDAQYLTL